MANGDPTIQGQVNSFTNTTEFNQTSTPTNTFKPAVIIRTAASQQGLISFATAEGVVGQSNLYPGVVGVSFGDDAVRGQASGTYSGVFGRCDNGSGVRGQSTTSHGVTGLSYQGVGVWGEAAVQGGVGIVGAISPTIGVGGPPPPALAAFFAGDTVVFGRFIVIGASKNAAIPQRDGSHRLLYSMESPECWFEDFGTAKLVRGRAKIRLARDFAAVVRRGTHHVFLTPEGNCNGLYIHNKTSSGFEVREQQDGKSTIRFSYRIVAKRKDVPGDRFAKIKLPKVADLPRPARRLTKKREYQPSPSKHRVSKAGLKFAKP